MSRGTHAQITASSQSVLHTENLCTPEHDAGMLALHDVYMIMLYYIYIYIYLFI